MLLINYTFENKAGYNCQKTGGWRVIFDVLPVDVKKIP